MNIFDKIKSFFGQGVIRLECRTTDGYNAVLKVPYIGSIATMDEHQFFKDMENDMWVKHGKRVVPGTMKMLGYTKE